MRACGVLKQLLHIRSLEDYLHMDDEAHKIGDLPFPLSQPHSYFLSLLLLLNPESMFFANLQSLLYLYDYKPNFQMQMNYQNRPLFITMNGALFNYLCLNIQILISKRSRMSQRKCRRHHQSITRLCLKGDCTCDGILCESCIIDTHRHTANRKIDSETEPLSYFSVNTNKGKYLDGFKEALSQICQAWERGNQIIQNQLNRLQQTFLLQLNLICKTFALDSAEELENSLKYTSNAGEQDVKINIKMMKLLHQNRQNIQNLDQIQQNAKQNCKKIAEALNFSFTNLKKSFQKLDQILNETNIFKAQKSMAPTIQESSKQLKQSQQQKRETVSQQKKQHEQPQQALVLSKANIRQLQKQTTISQAKILRIKEVVDPQAILNLFLTYPYSIQYLTIQCPELATQQKLQVILLSLQNLKSLVLNCRNDVWKCCGNLTHYKNGQQEPLDKLEYFYDFRRDLEYLDKGKFFITNKINKLQIKDDIHYKLKDRWSFQRNMPKTIQIVELTKKLQLKNIWFPNLARNQFQLLIESQNFSRIEQITLGHYGKEFYSISNLLQNKLKTMVNLKCFVLIKTSHFAVSLINLFKKLGKLEVLVLQQVKYQGNQKSIQDFLNSLTISCTELRKISISHHSNISVDFICKLKYLQTLILIRSKQLTFNQKCSLNIKHLNLFGSNWDYRILLKCLNPALLTYLNIGNTTISPVNLKNTLEQFTTIKSLCLDKITLLPEILSIVQNNLLTLTDLSIAECQTQTNTKLIDALRKCKNLKLVDVSKSDIEYLFIKNCPPQLQHIVISRYSVLGEDKLLKTLGDKVKIIEAP